MDGKNLLEERLNGENHNLPKEELLESLVDKNKLRAIFGANGTMLYHSLQRYAEMQAEYEGIPPEDIEPTNRVALKLYQERIKKLENYGKGKEPFYWLPPHWTGHETFRTLEEYLLRISLIQERRYDPALQDRNNYFSRIRAKSKPQERTNKKP